MPKMTRTLQLKRMVAIDGERYPAIAPLNMHEQMAAVFEKAATVGDRHHPIEARVKPGKRCVFLERVMRKGKAVLFHAYIYTAGLTPDQVVADFKATKATVSAEPIKAPDGKMVEVVDRVAAIVFGDAIVIESARVYGAAQLIAGAMRALIRRHHNSQFPNFNLEDAPNRDFKTLAKAHGGTVKVTARLQGSFTPAPESFGSTLDSLFTPHKLTKFKQVTASIEAEKGEELDPDAVLALIEESEESTGLSGITVVFSDGDSLSDLQKYRERAHVDVTEVRPGIPHILELETAMVDYLRFLALAPDEGARVIDSNGIFIE